jgi:hypothetical protein
MSKISEIKINNEIEIILLENKIRITIITIIIKCKNNSTKNQNSSVETQQKYKDN